jgi:hypothetical protein
MRDAYIFGDIDHLVLLEHQVMTRRIKFLLFLQLLYLLQLLLDYILVSGQIFFEFLDSFKSGTDDRVESIFSVVFFRVDYVEELIFVLVFEKDHTVFNLKNLL